MVNGGSDAVNGYGWWNNTEIEGTGAQILDMEIHDNTFYAVGSTINQPPYFFYEDNMTTEFSMQAIKLSGDGIADFEGEVWDIAIDNSGGMLLPASIKVQTWEPFGTALEMSPVKTTGLCTTSLPSHPIFPITPPAFTEPVAMEISWLRSVTFLKRVKELWFTRKTLVTLGPSKNLVLVLSLAVKSWTETSSSRVRMVYLPFSIHNI